MFTDVTSDVASGGQFKWLPWQRICCMENSGVFGDFATFLSTPFQFNCIE